MAKEVVVKIESMDGLARVPLKSTAGAAGYDLYSAVNVVLEPGEAKLIGTRIKVELPEGVEMQIRPRSGLALKHSVTVLNSPGTVDSDYRGEVGVILINHGTKPYEVQYGDRIAQAVFAYALDVAFEEYDSLTDSERGDGGFGHSGK